MWLYCKSDTKCNCTFNYETCIYDDSRCTLDCDCGCIIFYRLNKKRYNEIVEELKNGRKS